MIPSSMIPRDHQAHHGSIVGAFVSAVFLTIAWLLPEMEQPPMGLEASLATVFGAVALWMSREIGRRRRLKMPIERMRRTGDDARPKTPFADEPDLPLPDVPKAKSKKKKKGK